MAFNEARVSRGFSLACWGLALILFDLPWRRWVIPPDFFGWIVLTIGLFWLQPLGARIQKAMWIAGAMIALSIPELLGYRRELLFHLGRPYYIDLLFPLPQLLLIAVVLLLLHAIIDRANSLEHVELSHDTGVRRNLFLSWFVVYTLALWTSLFMPSLHRYLMAIPWLYIIVILVLLILLLRRASEELVQAEATASARPSR